MAVTQTTVNVLKDKDAELAGVSVAREFSTAEGALVGFNGVTPAAIPELADAANVAAVVTHLKALGLAVDPA